MITTLSQRIAVLLAIAATSAVHAATPSPIAPSEQGAARLAAPAMPLIACDPYFSIWSPGTKLAATDTTHWTGKPHRLSSLASIDGKVFRLMGAQPKDVPALEQVDATLTLTQTTYRFAGAGIELTLTFMTPALPEDIDLLSRPVTYLTYEVRATDGHKHDVRLCLEASAELTVNEPSQQVEGAIERPGDLIALKMGSRKQAVLARRGDDVRIDWGYLFLAAPRLSVAASGIAAPAKLRDAFLSNQAPKEQPQTVASVPAAQLAADLTFDLPQVGAQPVSRWLIVAYDDLYSIEYMGKHLRPYWRRNGLDAAGLLTEAAASYESLRARCTEFDAELTKDLVAAGGAKYAAIATLAYRQCFAAGKFVADANEQPLQFSKENHSNGCIATSDVFYPMAPQFLLFGPSLAKSFLVPFMNYAASDRWKFPFAPHDLGTYPKANGQVYGGGERTEIDQMPVEECGNLLLLMAAVAKMEGNASFAELYWPQLTAWADYLKTEGFDPDNQLCTDDFAGHLAHNVNLSAKAICALGAYAQLCEMRGDQTGAAEYRKVAQEYAVRWVAEADDGDHYRLTFDRPDTWSQKYNLVWDRLLGLNLFSDAVLRMEMDFYRRNQARYGLPLDNRNVYTKLDWILWTATLTQQRDDFEALVEPVHKFLAETPDHSPMTDWYTTDKGRKVGFTARPVVGGVFLQLLYNGDLWKKWADRDQTKAAGFAAMPKPPTVSAVVPAADREPSTWRFSFDKPAKGWHEADFDDAAWKEGKSGFGARRTAGAPVGQIWETPQIWLRREFDLPTTSLKDLQLYVFHDEDADIYLNGVLAAQRRGFNGQYETIAIRDEALASLRATGNSLAVHCRQTWGGQYIDVGLVTVTADDASEASAAE